MTEGALAAWAAVTTDGDEADNDYNEDCAECWQQRDVESGGDGYDDGRGRGRSVRACACAWAWAVSSEITKAKQSEAGAKPEKTKNNSVSFVAPATMKRDPLRSALAKGPFCRKCCVLSDCRIHGKKELASMKKT